MNNSRIVLLILISIFVYSCQKKQEQKEDSINGLWIIKKVTMGDNQMTPIARWVRFNKDSTQTSGNGWLQHSEGSWSLNKNNQLIVKNTNGLLDKSEPFTVNFENGNMIWNRTEEGENVSVLLERTEVIPKSEGNRLMGLWKIETISIDDKNVTSTLNPDDNATLFLRWDNTYVLENYPQGKIYGVYKVHGHKPEIQMVNYGDKPQFQFYQFLIEKNKLILKSTDQKTKLELKRIYQFLK
ncbi:hypothetical protein FDT66_05450 [Polaribacter aestuariivivens]|uniref:Lipocalin-like domain-containing protein n=1 Tax=Polaribacter aestuariivivens TaxID=2304626 RepID=A0A5S3N7V7_9FLAO|nr:hypothetical protein [Polaribacter aestuariivivens]TMM31410.1 hypothetical protein FDT66_05450 [Polaribacter aestuariivivens]